MSSASKDVSAGDRISVLIADDQRLVRDGLASELRRVERIEVVGTAEGAESAVTQSLRLEPDVLLLDMDMPGRSVFDANIEIISALPDTRVVYLTGFISDSAIDQALALDASAILTKNNPIATLEEAIVRAYEGGTFFCDTIVDRIEIGPDGPRPKKRDGSPVAHLTPREREVLRYVAAGMSKKDMAQTMHLSVKTIENHTSTLMSKLEIHDRVGLARFAIRHGVAQA